MRLNSARLLVMIVAHIYFSPLCLPLGCAFNSLPCKLSIFVIKPAGHLLNLEPLNISMIPLLPVLANNLLTQLPLFLIPF